MFLIGLELSFQRLRDHAPAGVRAGRAAGRLCAAVIAGIAALFGNGGAASVIIGACLALSSTAIVIEVLSDQRRLTTAAGRASFAILLAQDLAVVPLLLLVSILGARTGGSLLTGLALALGPCGAGDRR